MKFVLAETRRYWWPVNIKMPVEGNPRRAGQMDDYSIKVEFAAMALDAAKALDRVIAALPPAERSEREHDHLISVVTDWDDVVDEAGEPVTFTVEAFRQALQTTWFRVAIYEAYATSLTGEAARRKN